MSLLHSARAAFIAAWEWASPIRVTVRATMAPVLAAAENRLGPDASIYLGSAAFTIIVASFIIQRRPGVGPMSNQRKSARKGAAAMPVDKAAKKNKGRVRMCRFCEVEVASKSFMEAHVAGKKHRKLAGTHKPDQCWIWVEKVNQEEAEPEKTEELPAAPTPEDESWVFVDAGTKKKAARIAAAERKAAAATTVIEPTKREEVKQRAPVHRFCNECKARAEDGATIETDPNDETKAYCSECWDGWYSPPDPVLEVVPTSEPKRIITKWNRD